jgi:hypothetical protein
MYHREEPTEFERRWLLRIERRAERRAEMRQLRGLYRHRLLYRLGLIALGLCVVLLALVVIFGAYILLL